jgi:hypothetical protein
MACVQIVGSHIAYKILKYSSKVGERPVIE